MLVGALTVVQRSELFGKLDLADPSYHHVEPMVTDAPFLIASMLPQLKPFNEVARRQPAMNDSNEKANIELGMKVSVRRSGRNRIAVVTRVQGDYVIVRWTNSDLGDTAEYEAHRDDVTPLAGWL
jgi:hypothetical protein